jgi:hypothetical protein
MIQRYLLLTVLLVFGLIAAISLHRPLLQAGGQGSLHGGQDRSEIIKFSHQYHIEEAAIECGSCHPAASTSTFSSENLLGGKADCAGCHDVQDTDDCLKCHIDNTKLVKFENPVREVIFSHELHVTGQGMQCETCHAGLEKVAFSGKENMPSMATCNTCHNDREVTNTCEACHTNFTSLLPPDHLLSDFTRNHRDMTRLGALETSCQTCHTEASCQECHQGAGLKAFSPRDRVTDAGPRRSTWDSPDQTVLQNVHSLNYRFTHGIDAKARQADCASCHSTQTFCADCHSAGGNITQIRFKPASHSVAGFTTLGAGTGGGLHALEARRDIENCMSCHDVEGRDPSCFTCHADNGRVR